MGFGCWAIGGKFWGGDTPLGWGDVDDEESIRALHAAYDLGITFFDTASVYGAGHSEYILGKAFAGKRDQVVIATKFGPVFDEESRQATGGDASPAGIRRSCEDSLRRLNTDYIDLFQFHFNDHPVEQAGEVRDTLEDLVAAGKIRAFGWSTDFPDRAEFFAGAPHCAAIQFQCNVLDDNPANVQICEKHNLAAINRGPLAMGLLSGKYNASSKLGIDDVRGTKNLEWMIYFKDGAPHPVWLAKMEAVREILTSNGRTLAQGALAWLWARSEKMLPIPGIRSVQQARENAGALDFGPLTPAQMAEIERILGRSQAA